MSYDMYTALARQQIEKMDRATELEQLTVEAAGGRKQDALKAYLKLVHSTDPTQPSLYARELIQPELARLDGLGLRRPAAPAMGTLPYGSAFLQFEFTLAAPFLSKDDMPFYISEAVNPVRKDKVFRIPMMPASAWKGLLRWTLMQIWLVERSAALSADEFARGRFQLAHLFGDEKGEGSDKAEGVASFLDNLRPDAKGRFRELVKTYFGLASEEEMPHFSGRLMCYPTFFDRIDVEVINPHSRETKAGTQPIYLESVPIGAKGVFTLLYVPFDRVGQDEAETRRQVAQDLPLLAEGLQAMFTLYGFSAKRTSGFGLADNGVADGWLAIHAPGFAGPHAPASTRPAAPPPPALPRYLAAPGRLKPEYLNADGTFRERNAAELSALKKVDRQAYEKAKKWWEQRRASVEGPSAPSEPPAPVETPVDTPTVALLQRDFNSLSELVSRADEVAEALQRGGAR